MREWGWKILKIIPAPFSPFMLVHKRIKVNKRYVEAISIKLLTKNLVLLRASKGYVMCGYLDLKAAERFNEAAVKITGVSTIEQAIKATVHSCSLPAKKLGIYKGQPIKEVLALIS